MLNSQPTVHSPRLNEASGVHASSCKAITVFLHLEALGSTSALWSGDIVNSKITNKMHKKCENHGTQQTTTRTLV